jgi:hypothetical protein
MKNRRLLGLIPLVIAAMIMALAAPAQAATTTVVADGATATLAITFSWERGQSMTITATDTKCNAHPAATDVGLFGRNGQFYYVYFTNDSGCHGGARSYSTGYFIVDFDVVNTTICLRGGGAVKCSGYLDNPYT